MPSINRRGKEIRYYRQILIPKSYLIFTCFNLLLIIRLILLINMIGVVSHSSGNHAQALALAAQLIGIRASIVMPNNAPTIKRNAVLGYGIFYHFKYSTPLFL